MPWEPHKQWLPRGPKLDLVEISGQANRKFNWRLWNQENDPKTCFRWFWSTCWPILIASMYRDRLMGDGTSWVSQFVFTVDAPKSVDDFYGLFSRYSFQTRDVLKQIKCGVCELLIGQSESVLILNARDQSLDFIWTEIIHWHHLDC